MGTPARPLYRSPAQACAALLLAACGAGPTVDAPGTRVDTVAAEVAALIGVIEGDPEYQFGDVRSVAADLAGRIYVADRLGSTLRVFGPDGRFIRWLGKAGAGPGEYEWPAGLDRGPDGRLYVRDSRRITVLAPRVPGAIPDSVLATWPIPGYADLSENRGAVSRDGRYLYPRNLYRPPRHFYLVYADGAVQPDTLHLPPYANLAATEPAVLPPRGGRCCRIAQGLNRAPFTAVPSWAPTPRATVLSGDGIVYRIHETDLAGDTIRTIVGVDSVPGPVPAAERADSARALRARIDSLPVPLSRVSNVPDEVKDGRLPETLPAFIGLYVGIDGRIWVERWPPDGRGDERVYDVLAPDGTRLAVVVLPAPLTREVPPFLTADRIYGVVVDPGTGVERVVVATYRIRARATRTAKRDGP